MFGSELSYFKLRGLTVHMILSLLSAAVVVCVPPLGNSTVEVVVLHRPGVQGSGGSTMIQNDPGQSRGLRHPSIYYINVEINVPGRVTHTAFLVDLKEGSVRSGHQSGAHSVEISIDLRQKGQRVMRVKKDPQ